MQVAETGKYPEKIKLEHHLISLPKPNKLQSPMKKLRPVILLLVLRKILAISVVGRTFDSLRKVISISRAAYRPGRKTTELLFTFKTLTEKSNMCSRLYAISSDAGYVTCIRRDQGILLQNLSEILESDELHFVSLLLKDVTLQVKYNCVRGNIFTLDIGSPHVDCATPIWFV